MRNEDEGGWGVGRVISYGKQTVRSVEPFPGGFRTGFDGTARCGSCGDFAGIGLEVVNDSVAFAAGGIEVPLRLVSFSVGCGKIILSKIFRATLRAIDCVKTRILVH